MSRLALLWPIAVLLLAIPLRASLQDVKAEPNLEKRSKLALQNARQALAAARQEYAKGDIKQMSASIAEMRASVELAETSLQETGKNPRKSPKWFKRAEIQTRELLRRLDAFQQEMNVADRPLLNQARAKVQQVHDDLLRGVVEGKMK
jgi:hypothetical protein